MDNQNKKSFIEEIFSKSLKFWLKKCNFWGAFGGVWAGLGLALDNIYRKFFRMLNNAKETFNSIYNSIFLRIIH